MKSLVLLLLSALMIACNHQTHSENEQLITRAKQLLEESPDSALVLLDSVNTALLDDAGKAAYTLARIHARDVAEMDLKYDNEIFAAHDYFVAANDRDNAAWAYLYSAKVLWAQGENGDAARELLKAGDWAVKAGDLPLHGLIKYNMGVLHFKQFQYQESADHFKSSYPYFETKHSKFWNRHKVRSMELTAFSYMFLSATDSAFHYHDKAFDNAVLYNDTVGQIDILVNMAADFCEISNFDAAKIKCRQALAIIDHTDSIGVAKICMNLADIYQSTGQKDSAWIYLNKAHVLLQNSKDSKDVVGLYYALSEAEEGNGHFAEALQYHKQYAIHLETIYTEAADKDVLDIQKRHRNERLQKELENQKQQKKTWIAGLSVLAVIITLVAIILWIRAKNKALQREEEFQAQVDLYRQLNAKVQEAEKDREAREQAEKELNDRIEQLQTRIAGSENEKSLLEVKEKEIVARLAQLAGIDTTSAGEGDLKAQLDQLQRQISDTARQEKELAAEKDQLAGQLAQLEEAYSAGQKEMIGQLHQAFDMMADLMLLEELAKPKTQKGQSKVKKILQNIDPDSFVDFVNKFQQEFAERLGQYQNGLTKQEHQICCLFHFGFSSKAIALIMGLALNTVRQRRTDIRNKLSIGKRGDIEDFLNSIETF